MLVNALRKTLNNTERIEATKGAVTVPAITIAENTVKIGKDVGGCFDLILNIHFSEDEVTIKAIDNQK